MAKIFSFQSPYANYYRNLPSQEREISHSRPRPLECSLHEAHTTCPRLKIPSACRSCLGVNADRRYPVEPLQGDTVDGYPARKFPSLTPSHGARRRNALPSKQGCARPRDDRGKGRSVDAGANSSPPRFRGPQNARCVGLFRLSGFPSRSQHTILIPRCQYP